MNRAAKGVGGGWVGWVDRKCESAGGFEREVLQTRPGCRKGNLLVFSHQLGHGAENGGWCFISWQEDETEECAYKGKRLASGDKEASEAMRVRRTYTGRDRGLRDVRGSCLQLYLSSRIHSPHQDVWFYHPCLELAFSWNKYIMWICYLQSSASIKTALTWQYMNQIKMAWRALALFLQSTHSRFQKN